MGIPRFYRWVAERWPCVCGTTRLDWAPPTDNLFLNLTSVLQDAAVQAGGHGDTTAILEHVESSIEKLVAVIQPQSLVFVAVDGVLPKAKLIRHRSNKFRIAENLKLASAAAARRGEVLKTFDSNALTAGTEFMMEFVCRLKSFVQRKISQDSKWPTKVIVSGSDVPGEAEHKILDHLRTAKNSEGWSPNQRHCFYGLDASTLMAALVIHEPHCYLFKEKGSKAKGSKGPAARVMLENNLQDEYVTCSIGLLRDYLGLELGSQLPRSFCLDIERAVDDFVLFCVVSGNDFLPGLESFSGADVLMENLLESYAAVLPSLGGGYIMHLGRINGERLQKVFEHCSRREEARVHEQLEAISGTTMEKNSTIQQDFLFIRNRAARDIFNQAQSSEHAIQAWKERHYREKLQRLPSERQTVVRQYFEGLNWAMRCFYRGLPSWNWFYPHHYSPMMSDMKDMDPAKVLFRTGSPASLLLHLMSVIPRASHRLVPRILQPLIVDPKSPLAAYYPSDCHIDLEGKRQDWDAVVLLPFPDDMRLGQILSKIPQSRLSDKELERTKSGRALMFSSDKGLIRVHFCVDDVSKSPGGSSCGDPIALRRTSEERDPCSLSTLKVFRSELPSGTLTHNDLPYGYWTLHSLKVTPKLKELGVCLFSYPSERRSVQLSLPRHTPLLCPDMLIGKIVFVDWPSLRRARVVRVEDRFSVTEKKSDLSDAPLLERTAHTMEQNMTSEDWSMKVRKITGALVEKKGMDAGQVDVLVTVKRIEGAMRQGLDHVTEKYAPEEVYPLQAIMFDNAYFNHGVHSAEEQKLSLCSHDRLLYIGSEHPGTVATVLDNEEHSDSSPSIKGTESLQTTPKAGDRSPCLNEDESLLVSVQLHSHAFLSSMRNIQKLLRSRTENYYPSGVVATRIGVTPQGLSRITGSLWVNTGKEREEIGLAVKLGSKNMCVSGYVRPSSNGTGWEYTESLIHILESYRNAFHWVFEAVDATPEGGEISLKQLFPRVCDDELNQMVRTTKEWLNRLPLAGRPLVTAEACVGSVVAIEEAQSMLSVSSGFAKPVITRLPRSQFVPPADKSSIRSREVGGDMMIGDFVTYIGSSLIGFGSPGVVIGTLSDQAEVLFGSKVLQAVSIFGNSTKQCSSLVNVVELVNISRLRGESRLTPKYSAIKSTIPSQRSKSARMSPSPGHYSSQNRMRRVERPVWNDRGGRNGHEGIHRHHQSPVQDPSCTLHPVMPLPPYGSGVYIPGMTPMQGIQGGVPPHPLNFVNYSLTPRY